MKEYLTEEVTPELVLETRILLKDESKSIPSVKNIV